MDVEQKRTREKKIVSMMIHMYCQHHGDINEKEMMDYAIQRIEKCPMMKTKTFCSQCKIHCYKKDMQTNIKKIMRYSGPRMLLHHPILAIKHALLK